MKPQIATRGCPLTHTLDTEKLLKTHEGSLFPYANSSRFSTGFEFCDKSEGFTITRPSGRPYYVGHIHVPGLYYNKNGTPYYEGVKRDGPFLEHWGSFVDCQNDMRAMMKLFRQTPQDFLKEWVAPSYVSSVTPTLSQTKTPSVSTNSETVVPPAPKPKSKSVFSLTDMTVLIAISGKQSNIKYGRDFEIDFSRATDSQKEDLKVLVEGILALGKQIA